MCVCVCVCVCHETILKCYIKLYVLKVCSGGSSGRIWGKEIYKKSIWLPSAAIFITCRHQSWAKVMFFTGVSDYVAFFDTHTSPGADTPKSRHPSPCKSRHLPPSPRSSLWHAVKERPVRILLECILVMTYFYSGGMVPSPPGSATVLYHTANGVVFRHRIYGKKTRTFTLSLRFRLYSFRVLGTRPL